MLLAVGWSHIGRIEGEAIEKMMVLFQGDLLKGHSSEEQSF